MMLGGSTFALENGFVSVDCDEAKSAVDDIFGDSIKTGDFAAMAAALYEHEHGTGASIPQKKYDVNTWYGSGFYGIIDHFDGTCLVGWLDTEDQLEDFEPYERYFFEGNEVPETFKMRAKRVWDGSGLYVVKTCREIYFEDDPIWESYAESEELLAEGLYRAFGGESIIDIRKIREDEEKELKDARWFEIPKVPHTPPEWW